MFRILIVEDVRNTLEELCSVLQEEFPDALVEMASTVEEGLKKIAVAASSKQPFDFAVLDFNLPARKGENPEINESLCQEIKHKMPDTLVIHITAFHEDQTITKHPIQSHTGLNAPRMTLIGKTDNWIDKLLSDIMSYLVDRQLNDLFDGQTITTPARNARRIGGSLTHKLAALGRDITKYWPELNDSTRARVKQYFDITEDEQPVRVTLRQSK